MRHFIFLMLIATLLTGCMDVAMTSAQAVYNRHSLQKGIGDQYMSMKAYKALQIDNDQFKNANITIATYNEDVLLVGQVPESWQREKAEEIVKQTLNTDSVHNLLSIEPPITTAEKVNDSWITTKIKAKLLASDVDVTQIKVLTENGDVYLMGIVPPEYADIASDIASDTDGVNRVVKVFSYIRISKS